MSDLVQIRQLIEAAGNQFYSAAAIGAGFRFRLPEFVAAVDEIERLRAESATYLGNWKMAEAEVGETNRALVEARNQLVKAREALEPFGKFAAWVALEKPGWNHDEFYFDAPKEMPRFGAWRNALRVLTDEERRELGYTQYTSFRP